MVKERIFWKIDNKLAIVLIITLTVFAYANSLMNSFVWDDYVVIVDNNFIKSWKNFPLVFNKAYLTRFSDLDYLGERDIGSGEFSYRPLVTISYFIDYFIWKLNPFGYHLTNLILHIVNSLLLYFLIILISNNKKIALLASLFFALHPVNSEAVAVISFREDLLFFMFYLSAFIAFILADKHTGKRRYIYYFISCIFFLLSLFSKEMAIIFPLLLVVYDYFLKKRNIKTDIFNRFKSRYSGYIAILIFYFLIRFILMQNTDKPLVAYPMANFYINLITMTKVFATYIQWILLPINVHPTLPDDPLLISHSLLEPKVLLAVALIVFIFVILIKIRKSYSLSSFAILWFFITLIPVSNIGFPLTNYIASRYLYLPVVGFCLLIATLLFELPEKCLLQIPKSILKRIATDIVLLTLVTYFIFTPLRNMGFANNTVFWQEMCEIYPHNALAHSSLGASFRKNGSLDKAIKEYKIALSLDPNYAKDYNSLGVSYYEKGMLDEAINEFKMAIKINPMLAEAYLNLGSVFGDKGLYKESIAYFEEALRINPRPNVYNNIGVTCARMKKWEDARKAFEKALEINPKNKEAQDNLRKLKELGY